MHRPPLIVLLAFSTMLVVAVSDSRANTIYTFVNDLFPQNGYTIAGEIVTDGNTGFLSPNDIQTSLADPLYPATALSFSQSTFVTPLPAYFVQFNGLEAIGNGLYATNGDVGISTAAESFALVFNADGANSYFQGYVDATNKWSDPELSPPLLIAVAAVAAAPEPASLVLLCLAVSGLAIAYWRRAG